MTPARPASFDEIREFLRLDRWTFLRRTKHEFFEKVLDGNRVLTTHLSFSGSKSPSPRQFDQMLRDQLEVSREEFWAVIREKRPADRPSSPLPVVPSLPDWMVLAIRNVPPRYLSDKELATMTRAEAQAALEEIWGRSPPR